MAIKVPDNFRPSDYGVEISIPKPDIECRKSKDGSFSLYARYNCDISDFVREAAREMYDKIEAELMDELLRLNGYVPERTCRFRNDGHGILWCDAEGCDYEMDDYFPIPNYCPSCGAKVVE